MFGLKFALLAAALAPPAIAQNDTDDCVSEACSVSSI